jgi:hypothetical protein
VYSGAEDDETRVKGPPRSKMCSRTRVRGGPSGIATDSWISTAGPSSSVKTF